MIKGAYKIEALRLQGERSIRLGKDGFELQERKKIFGYESNFTLGWTWSMSNFLIRGQYSLDGVGSIGHALIKGISELTIEAIRLAQRAAGKIRHALPGAKAAVGTSMTIAKRVCDNMEGTVEKMCHKALSKSMGSASKAFSAAKKMTA